MQRKIVLIVSLVAGLIAALLTRAYLTVKENEIKAEKSRLVKKYGTIEVLVFNHDIPGGTVLSKKDICELPCIYTEKVNWLKKGTAFLSAKFLHKRYENSF